MSEQDDADKMPKPEAQKRTRRLRPFPGTSFSEALFLANAIQQHGAGQKIRRLTLFEALGRSPDSGPTRKLITASTQYGLTTGSYSAQYLDLTEKGRVASDPKTPARKKLRSHIDLGIINIPSFNTVYEKYRDNRLPTIEVLRDAFLESGIDTDWVAEAVEIFLANAREFGLIRTIGGSEHLVSAEAVIDQLPEAVGHAPPLVADETAAPPKETPPDQGSGAAPVPSAGAISQLGSLVMSEVTTYTTSGSTRGPDTRPDLSKACFIITPIGSPGSEQRKHADLVLTALIEPALAELNLTAVRADQISQPGLITSQVIDHVARAALVIADLSFSNPNVYYELALRQAVRKPMVQITRASDPLPFDVGQFRTYTIDMSDIYTLVPQIDLHRQEITRQCRSALEDGSAAESQLTQFYPQFWDQISK